MTEPNVSPPLCPPKGKALHGRRVVVTRAWHQAAAFVEAFEAAGAEVVCLPLIEVVPPEDPRPLERAAAEVERYDWVVFTSANTVDAFVPRVLGKTAAPWPEGVRVAVVGPATARAVLRHGAEPALIAEESQAEGLVDALAPLLAGDERVLVPQADDAREVLVEGLGALGVEVRAVVAYTKRWPEGTRVRAAELFDGRPLGWVTFTSPRIVRHFAELFGDAWAARRGELWAVSIGRVTSAELRRRGVERVAEAAVPSPEGMVDAALGQGWSGKGMELFTPWRG